MRPRLKPAFHPLGEGSEAKCIVVHSCASAVFLHLVQPQLPNANITADATIRSSTVYVVADPSLPVCLNSLFACATWRLCVEIAPVDACLMTRNGSVLVYLHPPVQPKTDTSNESDRLRC